MTPEETPEEYQRRLRREQAQRYRDRKAAEKRGEPLPPVRPGRPTYTPGPGEESRADRRKRQNREASQRFRLTDWGKQQQSAHNTSEQHREVQRAYDAKPETKKAHAKRMRERRQYDRIRRETSGEKRSPPGRMPWLIRSQRADEVEYEPFNPAGDQERAAANRQLVQDMRAKEQKKLRGGRMGQQAHWWWRKI